MLPSSEEEMGSQISFIINYTEGWTSGDMHYNAFVKAEKDMKSYHSSPPWLFFFFFFLLARKAYLQSLPR